MSKSLLYAGSNTTQTTVANGTVVGFNNLVRRYGCDVQLSGGNVAVKAGYYDVDTSLSFTANDGGTVEVSIYKDGVIIPYATKTISVANSVKYAVEIPATVRQKCCCESIITVVVSGVATTVTNASIRVVKE